MRQHVVLIRRIARPSRNRRRARDSRSSRPRQKGAATSAAKDGAQQSVKPAMADMQLLNSVDIYRSMERTPQRLDLNSGYCARALPFPQSSTIRAVRSCPAVLTGRSANTMAFGETPFSTSRPSLRLALLELRTNSDGTTSDFACPMDFSSGTCGFLSDSDCAESVAGAQTKPIAAMAIKAARRIVIGLPPSTGEASSGYFSPIRRTGLAISRQSRFSARWPQPSSSRQACLVIPLLPPINNGLNFHQTHKGAAEAAGPRITEAQGNIRNPCIGFHEQTAGRVETNFGNHISITGAHFAEMTLK
jgi:hypothetical protein